MGSRALKLPAAGLYDQDFAAWTAETARLIRSGRIAEVDLEHVAEEIEDMGKRDSREVKSRLTVLLVHLLKWNLQPQRRSRSWSSTIATQRREMNDIFSQSPSLRDRIPGTLARVYRDAVHAAVIETGLSAKRFPLDCPFGVEEILDRDFLPE